MGSHNSGSNYAVTITTSPTLIINYDRELETPPRNSLVLANVSGVTVYLGYSANLTTANGFPFVSGERTSEEMYHGQVYGIVATGTAELRVRSY